MSGSVDPAMRAAYESLTAEQQAALAQGDVAAKRALRDAYLAQISASRPTMNRAMRRALMRKKRSK